MSIAQEPSAVSEQFGSIIVGTKDAAKYLGIPYHLLRRHGDYLGIPYKQAGRQRLYFKEALDHWIEINVDFFKKALNKR